ncbi:uncharacterized protein [Parasteatoda tepidariorum]|uniref:uncharacterized protein n=1 Tax=Parasteatoda tepidariorum TaxID=114398 RepID=UPI0039BCB9F9
MIAWILRFSNNSLKRNKKIEGELLVTELEIAEKKLVKFIQQDHFKQSECHKQLKSLCTFHDDDGLFRLKTKIIRRQDEENFLCPIILPSNNDVVNKLIHERHLKLSHAGTQVVLTNIRQQFWILRGRKTVQREIAKCVRCRRHAAKGVESIPTSLPEDGTRDTLVFEVIGIDLAGPLYMKTGEKLWILLFTCAVYCAIHLELLKNVSTNCFLLDLRRFIARDGWPRIIYSDNGSNFLGASILIKSLNWDQIIRDTSIYRIQWKFNPPAAPWWGGWWERIAQMVKSLLKKVLGKACLVYEPFCVM